MIQVIDIGTGNIGSVLNMLKRVGTRAEVTDRNEAIEDADKLILPGIGSFDGAMQNIRKKGLYECLNRAVLERRIPILGICVGMQVMAEASEEGKESGFGWIPGLCRRFDSSSLPIPHMGWNTLKVNNSNKLLADLPKDSRFYFVHSYFLQSSESQTQMASTTYGQEFTSVVGKEHISGVQFHPEKSHKFGMQVLKNFVEHC